MVTIEKVPICATGIEYPLSSGPRTFTEQDLVDAIAAHERDPSIKDPRLSITLGHTKDGETWTGPGTPNFGYFSNLHLSDDRQEILASLTTLDWLADILPVVYPNRSITGRANVHVKSTGRRYGAVIESVALLGIELPGVSTLDDMREVLTDPEVQILANDRVAASSTDVVVRAQIDAEDVRRKFYDEVAGKQDGWWWIRSIRLAPDEVIATDEEDGQLYRVPFNSADRELAFGTPVAVYEQFMDEPRKNQEPLTASKAVIASWSNAADSRKDMEDSVDRKKLLAQLGLSEDATDEQMNARIAQLRAAADEGDTSGAGPKPDEDDGTADDADDADSTEVPDESSDKPQTPAEDAPAAIAATADTVMVDRETYNALIAGAKDGSEARKQQLKERRSDKIEAAVKAGKIPSARRKHYAGLMAADEQGTTALLDGLEPGLIPVDQEKGNDSDIEANASPVSYMTDGLSYEELQKIAAHKAKMAEVD